MDRQRFYDPMLIEATHLNRLQDDTEAADGALVLDHLGAGIAHGLGITENGTPDMHLVVAAGVAYTPAGLRAPLASPATPSLATDYLNASTAVSSGQERYVSLFLFRAPTPSEAYSDPAAYPTTGYLRESENATVRVVAGASAAAGTATMPAAPNGTDYVLLGSILRTFGQTVLHTTDVLLGDVERAHRAADVHADSVERRLECSPTDPPSLTVVVSAGEFQYNGARYHFDGNSVSLSPAPSTHPRIDLVYLTSALTLAVRTGVEGASPAYPSTRGVLPVAFVGLDPAQTAILDEHIEDARPWLAAESALARVYRLVATGGETVITPGFSYQTGAHALQVTLNGAVLDETEYTETSSTTLTVSALSTSDVLVVKALEVTPLSAGPLSAITDDLSGLLVGPVFVEVTGAGAVNVGAVQCCVIGNVRRHTTGTSSVTLPSLSANTWYYLYALPDGDSGLAFELSPTAPSASSGYTQMTGDPTRRYLASLRADATPQLLPMRRVGSRTVYRRTDALATAMQALAAGAATSWADVSCASQIPPHARMGRFRAVLSGDPGGGSAELRTKGTSTYSAALQTPAIAGGMVASEEMEMETSGAQALQYQVSSLSSLSVWVTSFEE